MEGEKRSILYMKGEQKDKDDKEKQYLEEKEHLEDKEHVKVKNS